MKSMRAFVMVCETGNLFNTLGPAVRDIFIEKMYLTENSTRSHLPQMIKFVESYDRWIDNAMPLTGLARIDHQEEKLFPFCAFERSDPRQPGRMA